MEKKNVNIRELKPRTSFIGRRERESLHPLPHTQTQTRTELEFFPHLDNTAKSGARCTLLEVNIGQHSNFRILGRFPPWSNAKAQNLTCAGTKRTCSALLHARVWKRWEIGMAAKNRLLTVCFSVWSLPDSSTDPVVWTSPRCLFLTAAL